MIAKGMDVRLCAMNEIGATGLDGIMNRSSCFDSVDPRMQLGGFLGVSLILIGSSER